MSDTNTYKGTKIGTYPKPSSGGDAPTAGTVTSVSITPGNGFNGTVNNPTTTPAISIATSVTGILKGNGLAVSAATNADIIPSNVLTLASGLLTSTVRGVVSNAVAIPTAVPTTNTLVNNGNNTITSTVDGIASTTDLVLSAFTVKPSDNFMAISVNGVGNVQVPIVSTISNATNLNQATVTVNGQTSEPAQIVTDVDLILASSDLTVKVNGVSSPTVDLSTIIPPTGVTSFNTRTGAVMPISGDYTVAQVTGAAPLASPVFVGTPTAPTRLPDDNSTKIATTAYVDTGLAIKADLNSPALTGAPTAPTQTQGDNSTKIATTAYVAASAAAGVTSFNTRTGAVTPASGDYTVAQVTGAAPLASPALTGAPTAPTQTQGDNSTKLATTAYVDAGLISTGVTSFNTRTGAVTPTLGDYTVAQVTGAAPLASPALTGTPTAPTPLTSDNSTKLATTAYVTAKVPVTTNTLNSSINTMTSTVNSVSSSAPIVNSSAISTAANNAIVTINGVASTSALIINTNALNSSVNTLTSTVNGIAATGVSIINSHTLSSAVNTMTDSVNGVSANASIINTNALNSSVNTLTSTVNGIAATGVSIINSHTLSSAVNTMTNVVNGVSSSAPIVNSNALSLVSTSLTETVNGLPSNTVSVCPGPQSITSIVDFTSLTEIVLLVAPLRNAIGTYNLQIKYGVNPTGANPRQELNIIFSVSGNSSAILGDASTATIEIIQLNDSQGVITAANVSNFLLFRGFYSDNATPYFAVGLSMPYSLIYGGVGLFVTVWQYSASFLNDNSALAATITTDIVNLVSVYPASTIFNMKVSYVPISSANPQSYVYLAASSTGAIFQYSVNPLTGVLTALVPASITTGGNYKTAATKLRNYVYAVAAGGTSVFQFRSTAGTGILTALTPASVPAPSIATGIAVDPSDRFVYVCDFGTGIFGQYSITKATGQLVAIPAPPTAAGGMQDIAIHPSGRFLYAINNANGLVYQYAINPTTGALTPLATLTIAASTGPVQIAIHPSGLFAYVANRGGTSISQYAINPGTGQLSSLSTPTFTTVGGPQGVTISLNGKFLYYGNQANNQIIQVTINLSTGLIGTPTTNQNVNGARNSCFDFTGSYLYVINSNTNVIAQFSINQTTGAMTALGAIATGTNSLSIMSI